MVNTEIRLIIFFTAKDGEAVYSQQKQDQELTVAQIMRQGSQVSMRVARGSASWLSSHGRGLGLLVLFLLTV